MYPMLCSLSRIDIFIRCNGTPKHHHISKLVPPNLKLEYHEQVAKTYKVVRQPKTPPPKPRRHLRKSFGLDEVVEWERWEHRSIAMDIGFH